MLDKKAHWIRTSTAPGTLLAAIIFGLGALAVVLAGLTIPVPGSEVVTDPRELFTTVGAAITGPIGGVIIGFLAGIGEPVVVIPSLIAHLAGGLWMGFTYRWLVFERLTMPRRVLGWAGLVLAYYYVVIVPGFAIGQTIMLPTSELHPAAMWTFFSETYATLAFGAWPEALLTTTATTLVLIAVPRKYHRPLWSIEESPPDYLRGRKKAEEGALKTSLEWWDGSAHNGIAGWIRQIRSTLAWRLAILLMLMSLLPIGVMVIFVRHTLAGAWIALGSQGTLVQARQLAAEVSLLSDEGSIQELLAAGSDEHRIAFIISQDGRPPVLSPKVTADGITLDSLAPNTVKQLLTGQEGVMSEEDSGNIIGYSPVPGKDSIAVVVMEGSVVSDSIQSIERAIFVQLGASLLIISIIGGAVIWLVMGPIRTLTRAAGQIGAGKFETEIDTSEMEGELAVLAASFNEMKSQLKELYETLERRVSDRTQELATLNSVSAVVSRSLNLEEVLQAAVDSILEVVNLDAGGAYRLDEKSHTLMLLAHRGLSDELTRRVARLTLENEAALPVLSNEQSFGFKASEYPHHSLNAHLEQEGLQTQVTVPLMARGKMVGLIELAARTRRQLAPQELSLLMAIGQQIGVAVENARLYEQVEESAVAAERSRLARELHDAVTQTLFSASLISEVLPRLWDRNPEEGRRRLEELRQLTRGALAEMRSLLLELRPAALVEMALPELLRQLAEAVTGRARVHVSLEVEGQSQLPAEVQVALYRIAQEALNNVAKHAAAKRASVSLRYQGGQVELCVSDDGIGMDLGNVGPGHLGLGIMRERAEAIGSDLSVMSQPGHGTRVSVVWREPQVPGIGN